MATKNRKIIQIQALEETDMDNARWVIIYALCDDGTVWKTERWSNKDWVRVDIGKINQ